MSIEQSALVQELRPNAQNVRELSGDMNRIVVVDDAEVFRFPKTEEVGRILLYEAKLLRQLEGRLSLEIPRPLEVAEGARYGVFSYVPGEILKNRDIAAFTTTEKTAFGQALATFMLELNAVLDIDRVITWRHEANPDFVSFEQYYSNVLQQGRNDRHPLLPLYERYYLQVKERFSRESVKKIVAHNDLHAGNLLFDEANVLRGIIDFGDCEADMIYSELRPLYSLGADIVQAVIDALDSRLGPVELETVRLYAIAHELSVLVRTGNQPPEPGSRAAVATMLLDSWLGDG